MYESDYLYGTNIIECDSVAYSRVYMEGVTNPLDCYSNTWLKKSEIQWTLNPNSDDPSIVVMLYHGVRNVYRGAAAGWSARPTVFLNYNVKIVDGSGSSTDPFILSQ